MLENTGATTSLEYGIEALGPVVWGNPLSSQARGRLVSKFALVRNLLHGFSV